MDESLSSAIDEAMLLALPPEDSWAGMGEVPCVHGNFVIPAVAAAPPPCLKMPAILVSPRLAGGVAVVRSIVSVRVRSKAAIGSLMVPIFSFIIRTKKARIHVSQQKHNLQEAN